MNPLQYTSEEMFSSTELIRKSKLVFDKLHNKEIEKAIILRDGKPSFMLLDFTIYEKLMNEYILLKNLAEEQNIKISPKKKETKHSDFTSSSKSSEIENIVISEKEEMDELNEKDLKEALAQIEDLDLENITTKGTINANTNKEDKEPLKEFWE